jgi:hypothetical protein
MNIVNEDCTPMFGGMVKIVRASGYRIPTAVPEFVDNSIAKYATNVTIVTIPENDDKSRLGAIAVIDNGTGMAYPKLYNSFAMAQVITDRDAHDIGSFHMGMKSAAISLGDNVTIISRTAGENIAGVHANIPMMCTNNTFKPTHTSNEVTEEWAIKFVPRDIYAKFIENPTGTLVYVDHLRPIARQPYNTTNHELMKSSSYSKDKVHPDAVPFTITLMYEGGSHVIPLVDMFYRDDETKLAYSSYNTRVRIYRDANNDVRVIEENTASRKISTRHTQLTHATLQKPKLFEFKLKPGRKTTCSADMINSDSLPPTTDLIATLNMRVIQVTDETYAAEASNFSDDNPLRFDRKGFFFERDMRIVASAFSIGFKVHDRVTTGSERQRVSIEFPASCDDLFGSKFNKQMQDQMLPCPLIGHAIRHISTAVFKGWENSSSAPTTPETRSLNGDAEDNTPRDEPVADETPAETPPQPVARHTEPDMSDQDVVDSAPVEINYRIREIQGLLDCIEKAQHLTDAEKLTLATAVNTLA